MSDNWQQPNPQSYPPPGYQQPGYPYPYPPVVQPQRQQPNWLLIILACVGGVAVLCCGGLLLLGILAAGNSATQGLASTPTPAPTVARVGDTIVVDNVSCTFISVRRIAGDTYTQPSPGNEFIVVHVRLVNHSGSEVQYNPFDFHIESGSGNITDHEAVAPSTYTANNELHAGALAPGGTVTGDLIFQAKVGDHHAKLTWQPDFFGNDTDNAWLLGL
jgi:hypothetical protein